MTVVDWVLVVVWLGLALGGFWKGAVRLIFGGGGLAAGVWLAVVSGADAPPVRVLEALAGATVWVRDGSSYEEHLRDLSASLEGSGQQAIDIVEAPDGSIWWL